MALTRFKDARAGADGPVSGALQCFNVVFDDVQLSETVDQTIQLPAGCEFLITDILSSNVSVSGDPQLTVGSTAGGGEHVASVTLVSGATATHTIVTGVVASGGIISVRVVADGVGDAAESVSVSIWGYITAPPTSVLQDDRGGAAGY